ncbi:sensor histidine kinase [Streptomyces sp. NPDC086091]|uniref:sensor histidine kinase n=1 Tax=Streptomyces sp. NPDC086091 TaxID=3365751 RepID=UPI003812677F
MNGVGKALSAALRTLRDDLWTTRAAPLPPSVWLRWLPHGLVLLTALGTAIAAADQLVDRYGLGMQYGLLCAALQGVAVGLALWRPVPAWWLSTALTVAAALSARAAMFADPPLGSVQWPWTPPALVAQAVILFLLALRVPSQVSAGALALTLLATWLVQGALGAPGPYQPTGFFAVSTFAVVLLLGAALRGAREARHQLVEQAGITHEERARRTLLEERNRIARELHDVVAHHMSVISIQAQVAPYLVDDPPDALRENLEGIRQNALEALTELRRVLGVLRSENPDDPYGLGPAAGDGAAPDAPQPTLDRLDGLLDNTRAAGLDIVTAIRGEAPAYPPGVQLSAYRIVQEALSNVLRHAPGAGVRVALTHGPRGLAVEVLNSAPTLPVRPSPGAGHGLLGMRERAVMLGGHLTAHPTLHGGFLVSAFLPKDGTATPPPDDPPPARDLELTFPTPGRGLHPEFDPDLGPASARLPGSGAPARPPTGDDAR